jgi:IS4 transposase
MHSESAEFARLLDPGARACARAMLSEPGTTAARQALRLLEIRAWLLALVDDLAQLRKTLAEVDRTQRSARSRAAEAVSDRAANPSPP